MWDYQRKIRYSIVRKSTWTNQEGVSQMFASHFKQTDILLS